jgi:cysteine desulfurase/selenocysteine lyase
MGNAMQEYLPEQSKTSGSQSFDVESVRRDFPILALSVHGKPLVYLDNAATTQKPRSVIESISRYYESQNSNVHRGVHYLSQTATEEFEGSRRKIQRFLNAKSSNEIIFVRGATEAVNLVAQSYGRDTVGPGDEILISAMEHHSNIVPWQILCQQTGASLKVIPMNDKGELLFEEFDKLLGPQTRLLSVIYVSNSLGTVNPVSEMIELAHSRGVPVMLDAAQAAPHMSLDVQKLDVDFMALSGHKVFGPTGIGVLFGKAELLESMSPYQGGGDMISSVTFEKTTYNTLPYKFEAGTPNIAGAIGLGAAVDYVSGIGFEQIEAYEGELLCYATAALSEIPEVKIIGNAKKKAGVVSFALDGVHPHDIGTVLDQAGVAIRTGHHCAQPVMDFYGVPATARASLAFYNTTSEIDALVGGIHSVLKVFR